MQPEPAQRTAYEQARASKHASRACLLSALAYLGQPQRYLDVGCGPGHLCVLMARMGAFALGVDIGLTGDERRSALAFEPDAVRQRCHLERADLTAAGLDWGRGVYDLVACLEVAEHLPPAAGPGLCTALAAAVAPEGHLLFSAATPGQGGAGHLNERPHEYWQELLEGAGLQLRRRLTLRLRQVWGEVAPGAWWYGRNLLLCQRPATRPTDRHTDTINKEDA